MSIEMKTTKLRGEGTNLAHSVDTNVNWVEIGDVGVELRIKSLSISHMNLDIC